MRFEREINIYGDEVILKRFTANETSISVIQGEISAIISESELIELIDSSVTMYSKLASAIMDIDSLTINFSDLTTKYNTVSGQYTALDSKVAQYKASVDGLSANISQISTNLSKNYSTTTQMNAAIKASVDSLSSTVSKTYATTTQLNTAKSDAISSAKSYTDSAKSSALTTAKGYADAAEDAANANTKNLLKSYSTTTQMNSAITQKANEINAAVSSLESTLYNDYSTTTSMNSAIDLKINQFSVSVSSTYAKKSDLNTANGKIEDLETWKNEASLKITDSAIISTVISSSSYENSVESIIEQNADSIRLKADRISWESTYSSMTSTGTLTCRNATIEGTIHSDNGDDDVYMRSARLDFIRDGVDVGNIGTNVNANNNAQKGLTFDLEYTGHFMSWGVKTSASQTAYKMKWAYSRVALTESPYPADTLNAGCDIMLQGYDLCLGSNTNHRIFNYNNGIGIRSNDYIFFEIGSGSSNNKLQISSSGTGITGNSLLEVYSGSGITAYNDTRLNFYADLNMHGFDILNNSDERLKENIITPEVSPMELLSQIELFQYDWRENGDHVELGMLAQQVMEIMPNIVKQGNNGIYSMNYMGFIPYIIGAIQYLYKMINPIQTFSVNSSYVPKEYTKEEIEDALLKASPPIEVVAERIYEAPKEVSISKY